MSVAALVWFDLTVGLGAGLGVLRRELGAGATARAVGHLAGRALLRDPTRRLARGSAARRFTLHQLRQVVLLDAVLREDLGLDAARTRAVLLAVVGQVGARFIDTQLRLPTAERLRALDADARARLATGILGRFLNAEATLVADPTAELGFDVTRCHFVELCRELERPDLAPLFCAADGVAFGRAESPLRLRRSLTLAAGDARCAFRFDAAPKAPPPVIPAPAAPAPR